MLKCHLVKPWVLGELGQEESGMSNCIECECVLSFLDHCKQGLFG